MSDRTPDLTPEQRIADLEALLERSHGESMSLGVQVADLQEELTRVQRLPHLEWAKVATKVAQLAAIHARNGNQDFAKAVIAAMDEGKTYVNRILAERDNLIDREGILHKVRAEAEDRAEKAEARVKALESVARWDQPWCLAAVLEELASAADILLDRKSYDGHGHERIAVVRKIAREAAFDLRKAMVHAAPPQAQA